MLGTFNPSATIGPKDKELIKLLEKIRNKLEVTKSDWPEYLGLKPLQYELLLRHKTSMSALSLFHLSERLCLNPGVFETGKIDYVALAEFHRGNRNYLRPEYKIAAFSRKFTAINAFSFAEKSRGRHLRVAASRSLQIHEDFWNDWESPDSERINIRLLGDIWTFLRSRGLQDEDFRAIGFQSIHTHRNTHIGKKFASFTKPRDVYECLFSDFVKNIEQNHIYRITRLTNESCVVESRTNPDVADAFRIHIVGSTEGCHTRAGMMQSMPTFLGMPAAAVHETDCCHRGARVCRFFCDFSQAKERHGTKRRLSLLN